MNIDNALKHIAAIHQQHAIKCCLAISSLKRALDWPDSDWVEVEQLVNIEEPIFDVEILTTDAISFDTVPRRRHWILSHAIYPHAYFTMQEWFETGTPTEIFGFYLDQCLASKQYLSHNVSILFAFEDAWSLISTSSQELRFIERFCEFVTATFYGNNELGYQVSDTFVPDHKLGLERLLIDCLSHPGFWGHNLIALASICKRQAVLSEAAFNQLLANLHEQCFWQTEDEMDVAFIDSKIDSKINSTQNDAVNTSQHLDVLEEGLTSACRHLLLNKQDNLHQITLAESVVFLFGQPWVNPSEKTKLINVMQYFAK